MAGGSCRCGPFSIEVVPKGILKPLILKLISERHMHGFEIMEQIFERTGGFWRPGPAAIYPALAWLEKNNYIRQTSRGPKSERARNEYEITPKGTKALQEYLKSSGNLIFYMKKFDSIYRNF
ncbi:MAG: PadR family transcriptional regulator [Candidatus Micrarchaeia archaeon]